MVGGVPVVAPILVVSLQVEPHRLALLGFRVPGAGGSWIAGILVGRCTTASGTIATVVRSWNGARLDNGGASRVQTHARCAPDAAGVNGGAPAVDPKLVARDCADGAGHVHGPVVKLIIGDIVDSDAEVTLSHGDARRRRISSGVCRWKCGDDEHHRDSE